MAEGGIGDYFVSDIDDDLDDDLLSAPIVMPASPQVDVAAAPGGQGVETSVPVTEPQVPTVVQRAESEPVSEPAPAAPQAPPEPPAAPEPSEAAVEPQNVPVAPAAPPVTPPPAMARERSREEKLADALNAFMANSPDVQAAALVSLDGFIMASAMPEGMQEDRVGAMSAAILGLGERAAAELGRGHLSQVYIEGVDGVVVLMSAGGRAVLTALAAKEARLGLLLYDMRYSADRIGEIIG